MMALKQQNTFVSRLVLSIICSAVLVLAAQTKASEKGKPLWVPLEKFDETRNAEADINLAVAEAKRSGRRVLLDVGGEWCSWCHRLDTLFVKHAVLNEMLHKYYVVVKVNYSPENKNEKILSRYPKIPGYPHLFVLDSKGKLLHSQGTSELEEGKGYNGERVMAFLERWRVKK